MKKVLSLILVVCMAFSCLALSACVWEGIFGTTATTTPSGTTVQKHEGDPVTEILKQIVIEDYLIWSGIQSDKKPEEIDCEFFGRYGNSVAVYFHTSGAYETPVEEEIAGYKFSYPDSRVIRIWNAGKFYKMPEAHNLGLISDDDVEAIGDVSKDLVFKEPYFIYGQYDVSLYDIYHEYCMRKGYYPLPGEVDVYLDHGISTYKKEIDPAFFEGVEIERIKNNTYYNEFDYDELSQNAKDNYRIHYHIYLKEKTIEAVYKALEILRKIDGVYSAHPYYFVDKIDYHTTPDDEYYYDEDNDDELVNNQWGPRSIDIEKVWDFTTGSENVKNFVKKTGIIYRGYPQI